MQVNDLLFTAPLFNRLDKGFFNWGAQIINIVIVFACLFHLYFPATRKRRWRYVLDKSAPA